MPITKICVYYQLTLIKLPMLLTHFDHRGIILKYRVYAKSVKIITVNIIIYDDYDFHIDCKFRSMFVTHTNTHGPDSE